MLRRISGFSPSLESREKVISSMEKQVCPYPCLWLRELKSWERNKTRERNSLSDLTKEKEGRILDFVLARGAVPTAFWAVPTTHVL